MIVGLWIKKTINGTIREIKLVLNDKRQLSITALQDFEGFYRHLRKSVSKNTLISEFKEQIDYDHPLFYILFGFITGLITINGFRLLLSVDHNILRWIQLAILLFVLLTGVYWLLNRPLYRYGIGKPNADYLFGVFLLLTGIAIAIYTYCMA